MWQGGGKLPDFVNPQQERITSGPLAKALLFLALPMFVSAVLQNLQTVIDLYWVGWLGEDSIAAVAVSGTILMLVFPLLMGAATGTHALVARSLGARDQETAIRVASGSIGLAVLIGLLVGAAGFFLAKPMCEVFQISGEVKKLAVTYLELSFVGIVGAFLLYMSISIFQAAGNAVVPMLVMLTANMLNLILDPVFIYGLAGVPAMGVAGAALATVLSQCLMGVVAVLLLTRKTGSVFVRPSLFRPSWENSKRILKIGLPGTGQMLSRSLMAVVFLWIVTGCGETVTAAYGIGMRIHMIILMSAFVMGNAVATMVGQNLGAGKPERAERSVWMAAYMDAGLKLGIAVLLALFAGRVMGAFTHDPEVISTGVRYLLIVTPFHVFISFAIILGRGFLGAGDSIPPMICTVLTLWGLQVPLGFLLPRWFAIPADGIWWAMSAAAVLHGVSVTLWFMAGHWKTKKI